MPATLVDTFLACSIVVLAVLLAMAGTSEILHPYLNRLAGGNKVERYQQLSKHMLLSPGTPKDWGSQPQTVPTAFGLARVDTSCLYELDIDKVTRLNSANAYALSYAQIFEALRTRNVVMKIEVETLFEIAINLTSSLNLGNETSYVFQVHARKSGLPVLATLHCYVAIGNYFQNFSSSTSTNGYSFITVTIPNSMNGTALFIAFARAEANHRAASFGVYPFSHNCSFSPQPNGTFLRLNPLNYTLNVSSPPATVQISRTHVFSFNYDFNLTLINEGNQSLEYEIPRLLDYSPLILVVTGFNYSSCFAEWVSYPQLPIVLGMDFGRLDTMSDGTCFVYTVAINSALYKFKVTMGGT